MVLSNTLVSLFSVLAFFLLKGCVTHLLTQCNNGGDIALSLKSFEFRQFPIYDSLCYSSSLAMIA